MVTGLFVSDDAILKRVFSKANSKISLNPEINSVLPRDADSMHGARIKMLTHIYSQNSPSRQTKRYNDIENRTTFDLRVFVFVLDGK